MPISVFPERMDKLDPEDVNASLRTLETYIHYICERTEYAVTNTFRTTNGLGSSSQAISLVLQEAVDNLATLTGQVGGLAGAVTGLQSDVGDIKGDIVEINETLTGIGNTISQIQGDISSLDERVTALEHPEPEPEPENNQEGGN